MRYKAEIILFTLIAVVSSVIYHPVIADSDWVIQGNKVFVEDQNIYLSASPAVLGGSGWVEFEILSKNYEGELDIVWGFDGKEDIEPKNTQVWDKNVAHKRYKDIPAELDGSITLDNIESWKIVKGEKDIGNDNNIYIAEIKLKKKDLEDYPNPLRVAFNYWTQGETSATFYYKYDGFIKEPYTEYYDDWNIVKQKVDKEKVKYKDCTDWKFTKLDKPVVKNQLYKIRVWLDIPFKGNETVLGKYSFAVKPHSESVTQAINSGHLYVLDPWYNAAWTYRKEITITGSADGNLTNYQMPLDVNYGAGVDSGLSVFLDSKSNTTFQDIRFTTSDGETLIDYWLEEYTASDDGTFWVEFPFIEENPATTTYYIYFGNAAATDASSGNNTFLFFDDFPGAAIDTGKWDVVQGAVTVTGSELVLTGTTGTRGLIEGKTAIAQGSKTRVKMHTEANASIDLHHFCSLRASGDWTYRAHDLYGTETQNKLAHTCVDNGSDTTNLNLAVSTLNASHIYTGTWLTNESKVYQDGNLLDTITTNVPTANLEAVMYEGNGAGENCYIDWITISKFTANEPTITAWGTVGPPSATTDAATNVTETGAWFHATVDDSGGQQADVRFQYNITDLPCNCTNVTSYSDSTVWVNDTYITGDTPYNITAGLTNNTTYCYRVQIANDNATVNGTGQCFTTNTTFIVYPPTEFMAYPQSHNTSLAWITGINALGTVIRSKIGSYPSNYTDGEAVYNTTSTSTVYSPLTPGITYYYRAWGINGTNYSANYTDVMATTYAGSGAASTPSDPETPATWWATPDYTNMSNTTLYPIINDLIDDYGFSRNAAWTFGTIGVILVIGVIIYSIAHNPVVAVIGVGALMWIASIMGLLPLWLAFAYAVPALGIMLVARRT